MKHWMRRWIIILLSGLLALSTACRALGAEGLKPLSLHLFKVGKADAMVFRCGTRTVVLDTGEDDDGEEILTFLRREGVEQIDLMIITHFDHDHVGGADLLLEELPVRRLILPDYESDLPDYAEMLKAAENCGLKAERLQKAMDLDLEDCQFRIEPPASYESPHPDKDWDNECSLFVVLTHGKNRFLFTGDAEETRIKEWLSLHEGEHFHFLKVPHHGLYCRQSAALLDAVCPEYAVICDSDKHPADPAVLNLLRERDIRFWETKNGDVRVLSNGDALELVQKP